MWVYCWRQQKIVWCSSFWQTTKHNAFTQTFCMQKKRKEKTTLFCAFFIHLFHYANIQWIKKLRIRIRGKEAEYDCTKVNRVRASKAIRTIVIDDYIFEGRFFFVINDDDVLVVIWSLTIFFVYLDGIHWSFITNHNLHHFFRTILNAIQIQFMTLSHSIYFCWRWMNCNFESFYLQQLHIHRRHERTIEIFILDLDKQIFHC